AGRGVGGEGGGTPGTAAEAQYSGGSRVSPSTTPGGVQSGAGTGGLETLSSSSSRMRAPAFESGSLRLPHLGDCTQEGQPLEHGHSAISRRASSHSSSKREKAAREMPIPPGWPS